MAKPVSPTLGKYFSDEGIYEFKGSHYKARWFANALKKSIGECKLICEAGYTEDHNKLPQAILVVSKARWEEIAKSYSTWIGLTCFHYYDAKTNLGEVPTWLTAAIPHRTPLIHEYAPGKVAFLREWNDTEIYRFFEHSDPPEPGPSPSPDPDPDSDSDSDNGTQPVINLGGLKRIDGVYMGHPIDLNFEWEE